MYIHPWGDSLLIISTLSVKWPPVVLLSLWAEFTPALFQRQRSWQGQDGWPAEVKQWQDGDEAHLDTSDWPTCPSHVYSMFCCVGLHVNCQDIKAIKESFHPLCRLYANYAGCLFLLLNSTCNTWGIYNRASSIITAMTHQTYWNTGVWAWRVFSKGWHVSAGRSRRILSPSNENKWQ